MVAGGPGAAEVGADPYTALNLGEAYRHYKPIAAWGEGRERSRKLCDSDRRRGRGDRRSRQPCVCRRPDRRHRLAPTLGASTFQVEDRVSSVWPADMRGRTQSMLLLFALLLVLIFFGAGFALHVLWVVAVILLVLWLVGAALGRGESAGRHRFYRW